MSPKLPRPRVPVDPIEQSQRDASVTPISVKLRNYSPELSDETRSWLTSPEVCTLTGITFRQCDYWTRTGLLKPIDETTPGQGNYRRYSTDELEKAHAIKALLDAGLDLVAVRRHIDNFLTPDGEGLLVVGPVTITYIPEK